MITNPFQHLEPKNHHKLLFQHHVNLQQYEDNIIIPPPEFRDDHKPIPLPRTKKPSEKLVPEKRTIISQVEKALKGYTQSFDVELRDKKDPLLQLQKSRRAVEYLFNNLLVQTKGFKFIETLKVKFVKYSNDKKIQKNGYFNSTTDLIINETDIKLAIQASEQQILNKIAQWISERSGWTIQSIENHYINIVNYSPLKGSSYIKLPQELKNRGLINLQNEDNECFRWCHIRHLNPQGKDPQRIKKTDKTFICQLDYSSIEFPVTVKQINKIEKQNNICINLFGYEEKQPFPIYISKEKYQDHMELLLITEGENKHYVLIKEFNKFMFRQNKHEHRKHFCMYCLQCFSRKDVLTEHKNNCISINGKQAINMPEKGDKVYFKNHHKQQAVPFIIYSDFEALTEKVYGCKQNNNKSYTEAARVILGVKTKEERTIKLFKKLEWLPFYDEINVIKLCLVFKCLNGQCPEYLSNTLTRVSDISTRQSRHGSITLRCPKYSRETEGGRTFAVAAVKEWNKLPINIRSSQNVKLFKKKYVNYLKEAYIGLDHFSIS